ncbi:hypothetical protein SAMN04487916_107115 [Arthrobacter sp. ov407]|nr:hypothetical protein SAMN04487916_107115 [Arthrobacter sp. ov407]
MAPMVARWRAVNDPHLVALARAGAVFVNGKNPRSPRLLDTTHGEKGTSEWLYILIN